MSRSSLLLHSALACVIFAIAAIVFLVGTLVSSLPDVSDPQALLASESIVFEDASGRELFRFFDKQDRTWVPREEVSEHFVQAIIAIEDKRFFDRPCVDVRALARAVIANIASYKSQGGSTITQQLARTVFLQREKTFERKIREIFLACKLESAYTKDEILEFYVNWIPFGHGIAGIEQASQTYFGKSASDLSLVESVLLASLPQRPSYFSPYGPHQRTTVHGDAQQAIRQKKITNVEEIADSIQVGLRGTDIRVQDALVRLPGRSEKILEAMHTQGYLSDGERQEAEQELATVTFQRPVRVPSAPHFVLSLFYELQQWFENSPSVWEKGATVRTTLDPVLQQLAERKVEEHAHAMATKHEAYNVSLLAVDLRTNAIVAYVGNADYFDSAHGGAIDMVRTPRQTGSVFKPLVYAALLENPEYSAESTLYDTPINPSIYKPHKTGYYGRMTVRTALARSRNIPAIRAFYTAGGENATLQIADDLGVRTPGAYRGVVTKQLPRFQYGWPIALGSAESSLFEMVQAYSVLARNGEYAPLTGIARIVSGGKEAPLPERLSTRVLGASTAAQLTSILQDEDAREPLWVDNLRLSEKKAAVKTGTSNSCLERGEDGSCRNVVPNNAWTIGFAGDLLVGVWVGNVDNTPLINNGIAIQVAAPLWQSFLQESTQYAL